jgi:hypothetical protein
LRMRCAIEIEGISVNPRPRFAQLRMRDHHSVANMIRLTIPMTELKHTFRIIPLAPWLPACCHVPN